MRMNLEQTDSNKVGVYLLHNQETGQAYVGSGVLYDRYRQHENALSKNKHSNYKLQKAYNKNPNFDFIGLPVNEKDFTIDQNRELALLFEQNIINENNNSLLLNLSKNVESPRLGIKDNQETLIKKKEARINFFNSLSKEDKDIVINKMRENMKGNLHAAGQVKSKEQIQKQVESRKGYTHSEETRQKISKSNIGLKKGIKFSDDRLKQQQNILEKLREKQKKKVIINNIIYESLNEAARQININVASVHERINNTSEKFKEWKYV